MTKIQEIDFVLTRMAALLERGSHGEWANALDQHRTAMATDFAAAQASMIGMFGGMGSLNDVILYGDGQPLAKENIEFDALRSQLYGLCRETRKPPRSNPFG